MLRLVGGPYEKKKKVLFIVLSVFAALVISGVAFVAYADQGMERLESISTSDINDISLYDIPDGTYGGRYFSLPIFVRLNVQVQNGEIFEIELLRHITGEGKPAEAILNDVLAAQSLQVDVVTGATMSSKVILLAIRDALSQ